MINKWARISAVNGQYRCPEHALWLLRSNLPLAAQVIMVRVYKSCFQEGKNDSVRSLVCQQRLFAAEQPGCDIAETVEFCPRC